MLVPQVSGQLARSVGMAIAHPDHGAAPDLMSPL
jgi:hypothetical protein